MGKVAELEQRLRAVETELKELRTQLPAPAPDKTSARWWVASAGRFEGDPIFAEIVRLGREYRESLRPGRKKTPRTRKTKRTHVGP